MTRLEIHPAPAAASLLTLGVGLLIFSHPLYLAVLLLGIIGLARTAGGTKGLRWVLVGGAGMLLVLTLMNVLFNTNGGTVLWTGPRLPVLGRLNVTAEQLWFSAAMGLRLIGMTLLFVVYDRMMSPEQMLSLFGRRGGQTLVVVMLAMRLFPLCVAEGRRILRFQACRGVSVNLGLSGIAHLKPIFAAWLLSTLERAWWMAESMVARGYGSGRRAHYATSRLSSRDRLTFGAIVGIAALLLLLRWPLHKGAFALSPVMQLSWQTDEWLGAGLLALLVLGLIGLIKWGSYRVEI